MRYFWINSLLKLWIFGFIFEIYKSLNFSRFWEMRYYY